MIERSKHISTSSQAIVYLLGSPDAQWLTPYHSHTRIALGSDRSHLIQTQHQYLWIRRRVCVQRNYCPLFSTNVGSSSARSVNQRSWVRHLNPSACRMSPMRERFMAICLCSLRYASNLSRVQ